MTELTREQAIQLHDSGFYEDMTYKEKAEFQINEQLLCMPFDVFHEAVEKTIGRPVFTHEFSMNYDGILAEIMGEIKIQDLRSVEILQLIPESKRVIVDLDKDTQ